VPIVGISSQALAIAGLANGVIGAVGSSSSALVITGSAAGVVQVAGSSIQTLVVAGTASGAVAIVGASAATLTISGTADGLVAIAGASAQSLAISGSAAGVVSIVGASTQALTITGTAAGTAGSTGPSDDFRPSTLNSFWTSTLPGSSSISMGNNGTDYYLDLVMPSGFNYDNYDASKTAPRILQTVANGDFTIITKSMINPTAQYQGQGIFVQGSSSGNWMRFDVFYGGSNLIAFAASTVSNVSTQRVFVNVSGGALYQRLVRSGNNWTFSYGSNGTSWTTAGSTFSHTITVAEVGIYGISTIESPGYTARFDYVEFASDPITSEDG
jgi:regulation of enolase protein 1 (concanavalin A-like superfamily)